MRWFYNLTIVRCHTHARAAAGTRRGMTWTVIVVCGDKSSGSSALRTHFNLRNRSDADVIDAPLIARKSNHVSSRLAAWSLVYNYRPWINFDPAGVKDIYSVLLMTFRQAVTPVLRQTDCRVFVVIYATLDSSCLLWWPACRLRGNKRTCAFC
jgi:hypothetical protein